MSQDKLSRRTGISKGRISKLHVDIKPSIEEIYVIALALEVKYNEIVEFLCEGLKYSHP